MARKYFDIYKPVFVPSVILIFVFIAVTLLVGDPVEVFFAQAQRIMSQTMGWFFILSVNIFLVFGLFLAASPLGRLRLGGARAKPDFSTFAWFSMLFSAGMGIGLLYFSVAEPVLHYHSPPIAVNNEREAVQTAFKFTFLHWGIHAWAIYAVVGLSLAFFTFSKGLPLSLRSVFYPLIGNRIHGRWGDLIDVLAVLATLFGLATSLGLGVQQVGSGLHHLFGLPNEEWFELLLIALITGAATVSVILGLDKGVRVLSELNIRIGFLFLVLVLFLGPTVFLFNSFTQNIGAYLQDFFRISTWAEAYQPTHWQHDWTIVYWAWWISWSPFVGLFIARVSKGRTVREFVLGVILVPSLLSFFWMSVFGGSAIYLDMNDIAAIGEAVSADTSTALFVMLAAYPWSFLTSLVGIVLVTSFFITSSDSGSLVIDSITAGGKLHAPVGQRIFWAMTEGVVAATLLIGGGLKAMQTAVISTGLPLALLLLLMCVSLYKGLRAEQKRLPKP
ncbi:MAG: BCCT family transporter [Bernardetiaceae bacterium]